MRRAPTPLPSVAHQPDGRDDDPGWVDSDDTQPTRFLRETEIVEFYRRSKSCRDMEPIEPRFQLIQNRTPLKADFAPLKRGESKREGGGSLRLLRNRLITASKIPFIPSTSAWLYASRSFRASISPHLYLCHRRGGFAAESLQVSGPSDTNGELDVLLTAGQSHAPCQKSQVDMHRGNCEILEAFTEKRKVQRLPLKVTMIPASEKRA